MKKYLSVLFICSVIISQVIIISCNKTSDSIEPDNIADEVTGNKILLSQWMSNIKDPDLSISHLSIPGTHDSGARIEILPGTTKCQNLSIKDQLENGVRFLDIRAVIYDSVFGIQHGPVYQGLNFESVVEQCLNFLESNPSEFILMSLKEEGDPVCIVKCDSFEDIFDKYVQSNKPDKWYLGEEIPAYGQAKGKIVLMRRFNADKTPKGINLSSGWSNNNGYFTINLNNNTASIQDYYEIESTDKKWEYIQQNFDRSISKDYPDDIFINFVSCYKSGLFGIPNITGPADVINKKLEEYFASSDNGRYGIIPMDFVRENSDVIRNIVNTNFNGANIYK